LLISPRTESLAMNIEDPNMPITGWLDHRVWPQIQTMLLDDAYFKLMGRARQLTGQFNGPIASLIEGGYATSQMLAFVACVTTGKT
jgi:acetoin utilization deacetylase AcuC-like enzyme